MKNLLLGMLAMAAMVSCSSENDPIDDVTGGKQDKVEIKLNAGVGAITTKATETTLATPPTIYLLRDDQTSPATPTWGTATPSNYALGTDGSFTLGETQKYYDKDGKNSFFIGYTPQGVKDASKAEVNYASFDGESDILCSNQLDAGTKADAASSHVLNFQHMLSQVIVKVDGVAENVASTFGTIETISIMGVPNALTLTLGETPAIAKSGDGTTEYKVLDNAVANKTFDQLVLDSKFVIPGLGTEASPLLLKVTTSKFKDANAINVSITNISTVVNTETKTGLLAGYKHTITLTFKDNVTISASIDAIKDGGEGSEDIGK